MASKNKHPIPVVAPEECQVPDSGVAGEPKGFLEYLDESLLPPELRNATPVYIGEPREEKIEKKKTAIANSFQELPPDIQRQIQKAGISEESLSNIRNFQILLHVLRFCLKQSFKLSKEVRSQLKSEQLKIEDEEEEDEEDEEGGNIQIAALKTESHAPPALLVKTDETLIVEPEMKKHFKNLEFSGKGGFGRVFFAQQSSDKSQVAIKKMDHSNEKEILSNLSEIGFLSACNHPNIVQYKKAYKVKKEIWLIMEFMEGGTLAEAVKAYDFKENHIAYVAQEVLNALKYLHAKKCAHRDLKSSNLMMTVKGQIKLIDFGLCADVSTGPRQHMVGSPFWIPPEMIQNKPHSLPGDIWSFAICILEMIHKKPPNKDSKLRALYTVGTVGYDEFFNDPKNSPELNDFLSRCLKLNPSERETAEQLLQHPFLKKADSVKSMETILRNIFINKTISSGGLL